MNVRLRSIVLSLLLLITSTPLSTASTAVQYPKSITISYERIDDSAAPKPLGIISYDPKTLKHQIDSWTPPELPESQSSISSSVSSPLLRILLPDGSSTLTSLSTFETTLTQHVTLLLSAPLEANDPDTSEVISVSITSSNPTPLSAEEERQRKKIERLKAKGKPIPSSKTPKTKTKTKTSTSTSTSKKKGKTPPINPEDIDQPGVKVHLVASAPGPVPRMNTRKAPVVDAQGKEVPTQAEQPEKTVFQKYWWMMLIAVMFALTSGGGGEK